MEYFIRLVEALSWPITILLIVYLFRVETREALERLSHLKYRDFEANFEKGLHKAEVAAESVTIPSTIGDVPIHEEEIDSEGMELLSRIAEISPRAAISEAWVGIERAIIESAEKLSIEEPSKLNHRTLLKKLNQLGILNEDIFATLTHLRSLRNRAAHAPDFVLKRDEAERYLELANGIIGYLNFFTKQKLDA